MTIQEIVKTIFSQCQALNSGTFFISTEDNHSCQIVINQGNVRAISYGSIKGLNALHLFKDTKSGNSSFSPNMELPMTENAYLAKDFDFFAEFDMSNFLDETMQTKDLAEKPESPANASAHPPATVTKTRTRVYRGQVIEEKVPTTSAANPVITKKASKKVRMYRGQIVQ